MFTTSPPCRMCETASYWANIRRVYSGPEASDRGKGAGMVYLNGKIAHKQANEGMIDEIVARVEDKAAELEAARQATRTAAE